jgi:hypothetical protein
MKDFSMNRNLLEICWIVDKRNKWAKERRSYRNKHYRLYKKDKKSEETAKAKAAYHKHNDLRKELSIFTKRLKFLLREEKLKLISDRNAGYSFIVPNQNVNTEYLIDFDKKDIWKLAIKFEAEAFFEKMLLNQGCENAAV